MEKVARQLYVLTTQDSRLPKLRESIADINPKYRDDDDLLWRIMQCRDSVAECDKMLRDLAVPSMHNPSVTGFRNGKRPTSQS